MSENNLKRNLLIWKLLAIVALLVIAYFSVSYGIDYITTKAKIEGYNLALLQVNQQIWTTGKYQVFNQTNSIPIVCQIAQ